MAGKLRARRSWRTGGAAQSAAEQGRAYPGWFVAIEGGDGAGKSTQLAAVAEWLRGRGFEVVTTREPGATPLGSVLRNLVLHAKEHRLGARAEALLFAADRADHMETVVCPALERGAVVLTDRHVDSSVAYQSGGRGLDAREVAALSAFATVGVVPDLVVLLDLDPAVARARREERTGQADKLEAEAGDFHERVRAAFLARAKAEPERYLVVAADQPPKILTGAIQDRLDQLLPLSPSEADQAARRAAEIEAAVAKEQEYRAKQAEAERQRRESAERERRERLNRELAERHAAEQERQRREAERAVAAEAETRARAEQEKAEAAQREAQERSRAERREQERRIQIQQDALRRREAELTVRQAEARAKERARLAARAAEEQAGRARAQRPSSLADDLMVLGGDEERAATQPAEPAAARPAAELPEPPGTRAEGETRPSPAAVVAPAAEPAPEREAEAPEPEAPEPEVVPAPEADAAAEAEPEPAPEAESQQEQP
ncbi:MAG TPA: dTMP kinase [Actinospica sp.]|nr:dTMP kinase [Actinospica sp.]